MSKVGFSSNKHYIEVNNAIGNRTNEETTREGNEFLLKNNEGLKEELKMLR